MTDPNLAKWFAAIGLIVAVLTLLVQIYGQNDLREILKILRERLRKK